MPSDKKKCGACKDALTSEGYSKDQYAQEENERRCLACVAADRPNTAAQSPAEKAERDAFVKACIDTLSQRSDVVNHTRVTQARRRAESVDEPVERDFSNPSSADVKPPPAPIFKEKIPLKGPDPVEVLRALCYDYPHAPSQECLALATALKTPESCDLRVAARAVEGARSLCEKQGAGADEAELALSLAVTGVRYLLEGNRTRVCKYASRVQAPAPKKERKMTDKKAAFDYSKWDHLDSDSDCAETIQHDVDDVCSSQPPHDAADAARFVVLVASLAAYGLCGAAKWTENDVKDCIKIARALRSPGTSWLLKPRESHAETFSQLRAVGPRYVFLLRDAFQGHPALRPQIATGLRELAFNGVNGSSTSASDGGVALVALASLCGDVNLRDVGCTQILRKEARLALPALADLARALGHGGGDFETLLGATLAMVERASGVYTDRKKDDASALTTNVDAMQTPARDLIDCGLLAALCNVAKRLDDDCKEKKASYSEQGERRLHRALQALMAQDPSRCGAFLFRASALFDVAVSDAFAGRCPDEAACWGLRLAVCRFALKTGDVRCSDCLRRALQGLGGAAPKVTTVRLARLAEALGQVAATPDATRRFLDSVDDTDAAFARERLLSLRAALGVAEDAPNAPEEAQEPPDDAEEGEKLKRRAERLEAARVRATQSVRKHLKALLAPASRGDAGKVD